MAATAVMQCKHLPEGAAMDAWQQKQWVRQCVNSVIIKLNHGKDSVHLMNIT
jgi:hypothetical protein